MAIMSVPCINKTKTLQNPSSSIIRAIHVGNKAENTRRKQNQDDDPSKWIVVDRPVGGIKKVTSLMKTPETPMQYNQTDRTRNETKEKKSFCGENNMT